MQKIQQFDIDEEEILSTLNAMEDNPLFVTKSAYRANSEQWPDHRISFVNTHLAYLKSHPSVNPRHYLANLRLILKVRT
jgi:hypothetical protein